MKQTPISEESFQSLLDDQGGGDVSSISGSGSDDDGDSDSGDEGMDGRSRMPRLPEGEWMSDEGEINGTGRSQQSAQQVPQFVFETSGKNRHTIIVRYSTTARRPRTSYIVLHIVFFLLYRYYSDRVVP